MTMVMMIVMMAAKTPMMKTMTMTISDMEDGGGNDDVGRAGLSSSSPASLSN